MKPYLTFTDRVTGAPMYVRADQEPVTIMPTSDTKHDENGDIVVPYEWVTIGTQIHLVLAESVFVLNVSEPVDEVFATYRQAHELAEQEAATK